MQPIQRLDEWDHERIHARLREGIKGRFARQDPRASSPFHRSNGNLMVAHRPGGYHSRPHAHDAEQLNYVQEGEVWFFVGERGFHLRQGDFFRVPRGAVHWMWNRAARPLALIETHAPSMLDDPLFASFGVRLFDAEEDPRLPDDAINRMVEDYDPKPAEAKYPDPNAPGRARDQLVDYPPAAGG